MSRKSSTGIAAVATLAIVTFLAAAPVLAANPIVQENARPGNPRSEWDVIQRGAPGIEGFATAISADLGETVHFKINTRSTDYRIDIYRLGWYGGDGARRVATIRPSLILPRGQEPPITDAATGLVDAGNWKVTASWTVPADAVSGVYVAKMVREDWFSGVYHWYADWLRGANHMVFIVRDDARRSDMVFQTADTSWHSYNMWGGKSFYGIAGREERAFKLSYNRPFGTPYNTVNVPLFDSEYPMIRWLEANGYDVSYISGVDTDRDGERLRNHKVFLSVGHDEYWSGRQRANVEAARDAGLHLAFFSGNEVYWRTRWEPAIDGSGTPYRTLVCYKETWGNAKIDPSPEWTGTWRDARFAKESIGAGLPENGLTGTLYKVDSYRLDTIRVSAEEGRLRFWRNTSLADLPPGASVALTPHVLGYEWDEDTDNGFRPAGAIGLSTTTLNVEQYIHDEGNTVGKGTATHKLMMHRAPSGALVFGAGTTRWSWGLDSLHINEGSTPDPRMRQATVNLFADMGVQPASLQPGLIRATASADRTPPSSAIAAPAGGGAVTIGATVTIRGTAADVDGRVGGVEVSTDGGASWHPAQGRGDWTYTWRPRTAGGAVLRVRATDDSLNTERPGEGIPLTVAPQTASAE